MLVAAAAFVGGGEHNHEKRERRCRSRAMKVLLRWCEHALFAAACFVAGFAGFLLPLLLGALAHWLFG